MYFSSKNINAKIQKNIIKNTETTKIKKKLKKEKKTQALFFNKNSFRPCFNALISCDIIHPLDKASKAKKIYFYLFFPRRKSDFSAQNGGQMALTRDYFVRVLETFGMEIPKNCTKSHTNFLS
jgi:hypothetical protein